MKSFFGYILSQKQDERGTTLIELLAATVIFLAVLMPLSSMYLSGVHTYTQTVKEINLQDELDFVTADIMKKIQGATYFELTNTNDTVAYDQKVFQLFQKANLVDSQADFRLYKPILSTYTTEIKYENGTPSSTVTKSTYGFDVIKDATHQAFSFNREEYLVYGLFQLDTDPSLANQKLNVYLVITPKSSFTSLDDLLSYMQTHQPPYEYIRTTKTQLSVNHNQQG
jgi:hypothetical protein